MGALKAALTAIFNANNYTSSTSGIASKKIPVNESNGLPSGQIGMSDLASVLGDSNWITVSTAAKTYTTFISIGFSARSFVFILEYNSGTRIGVYAYNDADTSIKTILAAPSVTVVTSKSENPTSYEMWVEGREIKIYNAAATATMYFNAKIL